MSNLYPLPNHKFYSSRKSKAFADDKLMVIQMEIFVLDKMKMWEKKKMLVNSIYLFSHYVFKRFFLQGR